MIVMPSRFAFLSDTDVWWPESAADVLPLLASAPVVTVRQCDHAVVKELARYSFRIKPSPTVAVDLMAPEEELWRRLEGRSCRRRIRKALELNAQITFNENLGQALALINAHRRRTRYARQVSDREWLTILEHADVFVIALDRVPIVGHVLLLDPPRVRGLMSATIDRSDTIHAQLAGLLNRLLHWHEILHYKERGFRFYDLGGVELDRSSPLDSISQFKLSFGAEVVDEFTLRLARVALLREILRAGSGLRLGLIGLRQRWESRREIEAFRDPVSDERVHPHA